MNKFYLSPITQKLAVFTILGILLTVTISLWVTSRLENPLGPIAVTNSPNQTIYIATGKNLFVLDNQGKLLEQIPFTELGNFDVVTDILAPTDNELFITDMGLGTVFRCDLTNKHCQSALHKQGKSTNIYFGAMGFAKAPNNGWMYVSNVGQHLIDRYDSNGYYQDTLTQAETNLLYPNDLWITETGLLVVTDTNHHYIVAFDTKNFTKPVWKLPVRSKFRRENRVWPIALAQAFTGNWWVINADGLFLNHDILVFDTDGNALRRIPLTSYEPEPISLTPTSDYMIVVDERNVQVLAVPYDENQAIFDFGDSTFRKILTNLQVEYQNLIMLRQFAWMILTILIFLVFVVIYLEQRDKKSYKLLNKHTDKSLNDSNLSTEEIHWIYPNKLLIWGHFLLIILCFIFGISILIGDNFSITAIEFFIPKERRLIIGTVVPVWLMTLYFTYISTQTAIGTDGCHIWLSDHNQHILRGLPTEIFYTDKVLILQDIAVQFRGEMYFQFYSAKEIKQYILPILDPTKKTNKLWIQWQLLKHRHISLLLPFLVTTIIIVIGILMLFYRFFA